MNSFNKIQSILKTSINLLDRNCRKKIVLAFGAQLLLSLLDLLGVGVFGVIGSLAIRGVSQENPGSRISILLRHLGLLELTIQSQVAVLGSIAVVILVTRSFLSVAITRKTLLLLSRESARSSQIIFSSLMQSDVAKVESKSLPELQYSLTSGVNNITLGVLGNFINVISDAFLLLLLLVGIAIVDPITSLSSVLIFGGTGIATAFVLPALARRLGKSQTDQAIEGNVLITTAINSFRELTVRNLRENITKDLLRIRMNYSATSADLALLPNISKYVMESSLILGALAVAYIEFKFKDAAHAFAGLSIFIAAGTRVTPAVMRIQQGVLQMNTFWVQSLPTRELMNEFHVKRNANSKKLEFAQIYESNLLFSHAGFEPSVDICEVTYSYEGNLSPSLLNISLAIPPYSFIAIVGRSGSGKSTLVDLVIGAKQVETGQILINSNPPREIISKWPGAISYVPQQINLIDGSVRENVALGLKEFEIDDLKIWEALERANLMEFVRALPGRLDANIGERGTKLSGGQRQRLGIARALLTKPKLLILDEATSALDGESENEISKEILRLKGETTLIVVAHRLSTIQNADRIIYLDEGKVRAMGSFNEVRNLVPDFDRQAELLGL